MDGSYPMSAEDRRPDPIAAVTLDLTEVWEKHGAFVWRSLRYLGVGESDIDDVTQDVFLVVHRKLAEYEGRGTLRSWLYSICVRAAHGWRRRPAAKREIPTAAAPERPSGGAPMEEAMEATRLRDRLRAALERLDDGKRAVFVLYELEQMPMAEIAKTLDLPLQTAYSRLHAARRELFRIFDAAESA
jgi:RNA polymerase sigma-70 factor (ECF subfamily)